MLHYPIYQNILKASKYYSYNFAHSTHSCDTVKIVKNIPKFNRNVFLLIYRKSLTESLIT